MQCNCLKYNYLIFRTPLNYILSMSLQEILYAFDKL